MLRHVGLRATKESEGRLPADFYLGRAGVGVCTSHVYGVSEAWRQTTRGVKVHLIAPEMLATLVDKLEHPLPEVRERSVHSLRSKVEGRLVDVGELGRTAGLPLKLVSLAASAETSVPSRIEALELMAWLGSEPEFAQHLVKAGAIDELERLQQHDDSLDDSDAEAIVEAALRATDAVLHHPASERVATERAAFEWTPPSSDAAAVIGRTAASRSMATSTAA